MDGPEDEQSCYAILGVDPSATSSEIRQARLGGVFGVKQLGSPLTSNHLRFNPTYFHLFSKCQGDIRSTMP